jgi:uncharacterized membrane protein
MMRYPFGHMGNVWGVAGGIIGLLFVLAVLALIGLAIALLIRHSSTPRHAPPSGAPMDPLEIAKRRLASGEITPEQFEEIKRRL